MQPTINQDKIYELKAHHEAELFNAAKNTIYNKDERREDTEVNLLVIPYLWQQFEEFGKIPNKDELVETILSKQRAKCYHVEELNKHCPACQLRLDTAKAAANTFRSSWLRERIFAHYLVVVCGHKVLYDPIQDTKNDVDLILPHKNIEICIAVRHNGKDSEKFYKFKKQFKSDPKIKPITVEAPHDDPRYEGVDFVPIDEYAKIKELLT